MGTVAATATLSTARQLSDRINLHPAELFRVSDTGFTNFLLARLLISLTSISGNGARTNPNTS
jgi:hypothetical protein